MGLNIRNREVEELARQIATACGETMTEAIRKALLERRDRLGLKAPHTAVPEMQAALHNLHGERKFSPVSKAEWDRLHE